MKLLNKRKIKQITENARHISVHVPSPHALIQALRKRLGMSQAQLAKRAGLSQPHVALIESGKGDVQLSTLERIFQALSSELIILAKPMEKIEDIIKKRAALVAKKRVRSVLGTMALEKQQPTPDIEEAMIKEEEERLARNPSSALWDD